MFMHPATKLTRTTGRSFGAASFALLRGMGTKPPSL
jgi:hypothetical protein